MTKTILLNRKSLLAKLFVLVMLLVGGGSNVWGDETVVTGNTLDEGWGTGSYASSSNKITGIGSTDITATVAFTKGTKDLPDELVGGKYSNFILRSESKISITTGKTIEVGARGLGTTSAYLALRYSATSKTDNSTYTNHTIFTTEINSSSEQADFTTLTFEDIPAGDYYIQILGKGVNINSVIIKDAPLPTLSITSDIDVDFGTVWANATKEDYYTITNNSASTVNVVAAIGGTDYSSFSISPNTPQNIASGATQTYTISYTYDSDPSSFGEKSATITFTPDGDDTNAITKSITANAVGENDPQLSVTPDDDTNLGSVYSDDVTYTVTNLGTGSLTVSIESDNSDFVLDKTSISGLAYGESETFTVTYTFAGTAEKLGLNTANITVTPSYDAGDAKSYEVSATSNPNMTLDESSSTTINYGTKDYLLVKYTPSDGWNTISMPIVLRNSTMDNMTPIFGEGWKAYTLLSYSEGTLRFSKVSDKANINNATPYLVYVPSAASHPNGVLLTGIYTNGNTPGSSSSSPATFQGTYATKTYTDGDNWYGVTPAGKVMKAGSGAAIKGYRAYFTGVEPPTPSARVNIVIEDDDETTDLGFVKMVDPEAKEVYNLKGQRVQKGSKGLYIVNGRKVVIK